jgi:hypothetical protein
MKYRDTVKPRTKAEIAMDKRAYETSEKEDRLVDKQRKAKKKSKNFATSADGYAKGGPVKAKAKAKAKPRGCGCESKGTRKTRMY